METVNVLIVFASIFWILVFFICLGPCLLLSSKLATHWKNNKAALLSQAHSEEYFKGLKHQRHSAPPLIIIRPPNQEK